MKLFSILITTKNRLEELTFTLQKISHLLDREDVECIICDDGSNDGTSNLIKHEYPNIQLIKNEKSKGLIYSRNRLLEHANSDYVISIDDDLHFLSQNPLENIVKYFIENPICAVVSFRIFWSIDVPKSQNTNEKPYRMKSFAGGAHVFRKQVWNLIPNYPDWFVFYGEEDFASFQLFKAGWEVHYVPEILVHHRVDIKNRKKDKDYQLRLRRSLRSGWYLYLLFYPWKLIPRRMVYSLWIQLKTKVFKGDFKALLAILQAIFDVFLNLPRLMKYSNRLTLKEFKNYNELPETKLYWTPAEN